MLLLHPVRSWRLRLSAASKAVAASTAVFCRDVGQGLLVTGRNALATVGASTLVVLTLCLGHEPLRNGLEETAHGWLQERREIRALNEGDTLHSLAEPSAVDRATAADIKGLPSQQARLAQWISRRYRVAPEPVSALVREAWETGRRARLEPTLILAIMAIESRFNPFAQSPVGAQGLMQVMTRVHDDKYESFGGTYAAFDPVTNLRVGVQVLKESIARGGSVEEGLRRYVGAALHDDDGGYVAKVMSEQDHMRAVLQGRTVAISAGIAATLKPRVLPVLATPERTANMPQAAPPPPSDSTVKGADSAEQLALMR